MSDNKVAEEVVSEHLDEMMSPREYAATKRALVTAITAALETARQGVWDDVMRIARGTKTDPKWGNMFLTRDEIVERLESARNQSNQGNQK